MRKEELSAPRSAQRSFEKTLWRGAIIAFIISSEGSGDLV